MDTYHVKSRPLAHGTMNQPHHTPRFQRHGLESTHGLFIWQSIAASLKRIAETRGIRIPSWTIMWLYKSYRELEVLYLSPLVARTTE